MQWENKVKFSGKVKTAGIDKGMSWKSGTVDFDYDTSSNTWQVKLYWNVDLSKSVYDMKISHPDMLEVKCGRMMIENKKGDGIHIKLNSWDVENAKKTVTKIKSSTSSTPKHYRAEVGLAASSTLSNRKGSENVSPFLNGSLSSSESSPYISSVDMSPVKSGWPSKKNPPPSARVNHVNHSHNTSKRKLEYSHQDRQKHKGSVFNSEDRQRKGMSLNSNDDREDSASFSSSRFTGVKDHSKRSLQGGNGLSVATNGLGAKSFYGAQNSLIADNTYKGLSRSFNGGNKPSSDRSPQVKRPRLSYPPSYSSNNSNNNNNNNKMGPSLGLTAGPAESSKKPVENSDHDDYLPVRQRMDGQTVGFENLGNTCFMNSPLQCLSSLEPLSLDIQSAMVQYGSYLKPNSMTRLLYLLMKDVRKLDVNPARVTEILTRLRRENINKFAANTQQDAHELLCELLDRVDTEVKAAMDAKAKALSVPALEGAAAAASSEEMGEAEAAAAPSSLSSQRDLLTPTKVNFHWFFKTSFYFHECKTEVASSKEECEMTLMLPLDSTTVNIQDCVDKYFQSSVVDMRCERCGKNEKATMIRKIVRRPRIFILNLLRYHTDNSESKKRLDQINIPSYMTIAEYCADDVKAPPPMEAVFMLDRDQHLDIHGQDILSTDDEDGNNNKKTALPSFSLLSSSLRKPTVVVPPMPPRAWTETDGARMFAKCKESLRSVLDLQRYFVSQLRGGDARSGSASQELAPLTVNTDFDDYDSCTDSDKKVSNSNTLEVCLKDSPSPSSHGTTSSVAGTWTVSDGVKESSDGVKESSDGVKESSDGVKGSKGTDTDASRSITGNAPFWSSPIKSEQQQSERAYIDSRYEGKADTQVSYSTTLHTAVWGTMPDDQMCQQVPEVAATEDVISSNNNSNNNNNGNRVSFAAEAEILNGQPHIPAITQLKEAELKYSANKEEEGNTRTEGKKHAQDIEESESEVSEAVKRHVEKLIDGFCELDRSLEMMQDMGDDMSEFYNKVQDIISEVTAFIESTFLEVANEGEQESRTSNGHRPEHQLLLCQALLHKALAEDTDHSESDSAVVAKEILNTHYICIQGETHQVEHLIQDLGKYLAAQQLNILKPDTPQKSSTGTLTNGHDTEGIDSDQEVTFPKKETQQTKKGFDAQKGLEQFDEIMSLARKMEEEHSRKRGYQKTAENGSVKPASEDFVNTKQPVEVEVDWDDECNNVERSRNLNSKQSVEVGDVYGIATQTLHGRDIGSYTQAELEQINLGSVTDAEMMLIAQTLSRLEYAKEQRVHREDPPDVLDGESSMEICSTGLECDETRGRSVDITEDQSSDGYLTAEKADGISAGSKSEEASLLQGTVNNKHLQDFEAKLHCDEELSDFDEPDGVRTGSKGGKTDSIRKTPPSGLNKKTRPLFPTPEHDPSSDVDESAMEEVCVVCGTSYTGECALCAPLGEADFGYQAFDAHLSPPVERLAQEKASENNTSTSQTQQSSKVLSDKCNTVPNHDSSPENLTSAAAKTNKEKSVKSAVTPEKKSPDQVVFPDSADKSFKNPAENVGDHVVPMSPLLSPRKELQLFSPSKPSNLVKTRDYARLRSPSASPKKRTNKLQSPKYGSASKRLHFPEGEKGEAKLKISPDKEGSDLNSESLSGASVEVNVDETSFLDGIDRYTFIPASLLSNTSTYSSPNHSPAPFSSSSSLTLSTSTPVSAPLPSTNVSTNGLYESISPTHQARSGSASTHSSVSEEATLQQLAVAPQINQSASAQDPQTDQSEPIKSRKPSHTELLQENTNPEKSSNFQKPKASRSLVENLSSAEEKENKRKDPARTKRLQQIEAGKADVSYRLVGIVDHIGESLFAGHYAAFAFNMSKNSWFSMDDKDTRKTTETTAKRESLESGYVFFYMDKELYQEYENKVAARLH